MTVALAVNGPYAAAGLLHGLFALENLGTGAIGGFAVFAALDPNGKVVYAETQDGGSTNLSIPSDWLKYEKAAAISSGPHRPEPLKQFLPALNGVGMVTGHRLPNRPFFKKRLNTSVLDRLQQGDSPEQAIRTVLSQAPEADAGLMAIDIHGRIAWANSDRVNRRNDLMTGDITRDNHRVAIMMNSIHCAPPLHSTLPQIIADLAIDKANSSRSKHPTQNKADTQKHHAYSLPLSSCPIHQAMEDKVLVDSQHLNLIAIESADPNIHQANGRWTVIQHGTPVIDSQGIVLGFALHDVIANVAKGQLQPLQLSAELKAPHTYAPNQQLIYGDFS